MSDDDDTQPLSVVVPLGLHPLTGDLVAEAARAAIAQAEHMTSRLDWTTLYVQVIPEAEWVAAHLREGLPAYGPVLRLQARGVPGGAPE